MSQKFYSEVKLEALNNATVDTDRFLVGDSGTIKYRTGAQVLSDIGGQSALTNPITGTGATNYVSKFTGTTSLGNSQIYDNGTNVGIGTTSPSGKFEINGSGNFVWGFPSTAVAKIGTKGTGGSLLVSTPSLNSSYESGFAVDGTYSSGKSVINLSAFGVYSGGPYSADIAFKTSTQTVLSEKVRITSDGNVGIGTSSPNGRLQVASAVAGDAQIWLQSTTYTGGYSTLGYNASTGEFRIKQNDGGSAGITFYTGASASEKMRITPSGNVGIGTTTPATKLTVEGILATKPAGVDAYYSYLRSNWSADNAFELGISAFGSSFYHKLITSSGYYNGSTLQFWTNDSERARFDISGNFGIGTTSPNALLDVAGDALINEVTIGQGPVVGQGNTALGRGALGSMVGGKANIAVGSHANSDNDTTGLTVIGVDLNVSPAGSALTQNSLVIGQYNNLNYSTQYPHIYAPDKVNCPNGDTTTDVIAVDYSIYTAIFMEYSIFNSAGDQFRAGTYTVAFKGTGTPVDKDNQTVVYSLTTLLATFTISVTGSIATIQLRNQDTDTYDIRVTARLLMR